MAVARLSPFLLFLSLLLLPLLFSSASILHTRVPSAWRPLDAVPPSHPLTFFLAFPHRNVDQLEARLAQLSDPTHPSYAQWLSKAEVDAIIAPAPASVATVQQWLLSSGVPATHLTLHGTAVEVNTTAHHTNRLFNTSLHRFRHSADSTLHVAAHGGISVPDAVLPHLAMILGVQDFPFPIRHFSVHVLPRSSPVPSSPSPATTSESTPHSFHAMQSYYSYEIMTARDLAAFYGYPDVTRFGRPAGYVANTSIAVTQYDGIDTNSAAITYQSISYTDLASQGLLAGVPGIQSPPAIYGRNVPTSPQYEPSLDIQTITTGNPTANATHWEENYIAWIYGLSLHLLAQPSPPQVVSISWGSTEPSADDEFPDDISGGYLNYIAQSEVQLAALGALGVTIIASSGDNGASGDGNPQCHYTSAYPSSLYVSWPASSPHVVAVGATQVEATASNTGEPLTPWCGLISTNLPLYNLTAAAGYAQPYQLGCLTNGSEVAVSSNFRSAGGFSRVYPQPSWQASAVQAYLSSGVTLPPTGYYDPTKRAIPDVAMYGYGTGVIVGGAVTSLGGTSLSAPLFAVVVSLLNEVSLNAGGSTLGFLNPLLYYMAANVSGTFNDVTSGDNVLTESCIGQSCGCQGFYATTGWDAVTGLGSPVFPQMAAYIRQLAAATPHPLPSTGGYSPPIASASLCLLFYSLPGNVDYPWSSAISLQLSYNPSPVNGSAGLAFSLVGGSGLRVFTNRFGASSTTGLTLDTSWPALLYPASLLPLDYVGLTLTPSSPLQLPGAGPLSPLFSSLVLWNASGTLTERGAATVDAAGSAWQSSLPGFLNTTLGASNVNALAADYAQCRAPLTFTNGRRSPTQPSTFNGAAVFQYSYQVSDGLNYTVVGNLTITCASAFATAQDALGNPYQTITGVSGTRLYTFLPTGAQLLSTVTGVGYPAVVAGSPLGDQRWYPYSLLAASPGVYSVDTAPFLDADGVQFYLSPAIPVNGVAPGVGPQQSFTRVYVGVQGQVGVQWAQPVTGQEVVGGSVLVDGVYNAPPLLALQRQTYSVRWRVRGGGKWCEAASASEASECFVYLHV